MKRRPFTARQRGFSLLEVILAVALLSLTALGASLIIVPVARQSRFRREDQTANAAAKRALERIQAAPFKDLTTLYPPSYTEKVTGLQGGTLSITYADPAADPLLIQADLSWVDEMGNSMQRTFNTVRTE